VFNERTDAVLAEFVAEGFGVVAPISSEAPQVAGIAPGDLRADPLVGFLAGGGVNIGEAAFLRRRGR